MEPLTCVPRGFYNPPPKKNHYGPFRAVRGLAKSRLFVPFLDIDIEVIHEDLRVWGVPREIHGW